MTKLVEYPDLKLQRQKVSKSARKRQKAPENAGKHRKVLESAKKCRKGYAVD